jgi:iron complex outermembrane receptor protein
MLFLFAGLLAGFSGGLVYAQNQSTSDESATPSKLLQEVVVTAQKRQENVQDVPVQISVVTSQQLAQQNIVTTSGLVQAVPTLTVTQYGVFQVRSLGTQGFGKDAEQSVSVVVDGVAMPFPEAYELANSVFDLNHVEVLSGPQGTLFGTNSSAGLINIVTNAPRLHTFEADAHLDAGTHDLVNFQGIVNLPVGETAALRVAVHHDAYGDVVYDNVWHKWDHTADDGVRARFLWEPTDSFRLNVFGDYQYLTTNGINGLVDFSTVPVFVSVAPGAPIAPYLAACGIVPGPNNNRTCNSSVYDPSVPDGKAYDASRGGVAVQMDWDFAKGYTLTSLTALRQQMTGDFSVHGDIEGDDGLPADYNSLKRNLFPQSIGYVSQELRVTSPAKDRVNYVAGLYFSDTRQKDSIDQAGAFGVAGLGDDEFRRWNFIHIDQVNYAAFGQVNFDVTPNLRIFGGGRVLHDGLTDYTYNVFPDSVATGGRFIYTANTGFFSLFPINTCTIAGGNPDIPSSCPAGTSLNSAAHLSNSGYMWKGGAQYHVNQQTMLYATVGRGYKGPYINDQATWPITMAQLVVKPEISMDYELGVKTTVLDRIYVDIDLFRERTRDFQTTIYVPPVPPSVAPNFIEGNAPYALTEGVDASLRGNVTRDFSLAVEVLYDDAHFNPGFLVNCTAGPCLARSQMPFAPLWKSSLSGEYRHDFSDALEGFVASDLSYSTGYPYSSTPAPEGFASGARTILGARAGVRFGDDKYDISVFCRNCTDKRYPVIVVPGFASDGSLQSVDQSLSLDSYRVIGLTLDAKW